MVLYGNDLICIFMNINENLKMMTKQLHNLEPKRPGVFLFDAKWFSEAIKRQKTMFLNKKIHLVI